MRLNKTKRISNNEVPKISSKISNILKSLKIKILKFTIIEIIILLFFTYYIGVFCAVYKSTQNSWLLDSFISFILTNLFEIFFVFIDIYIY